MTALDVEVGKAYVVNFGRSGSGNGLQIARCDGKASAGDVILRSRCGILGLGHWSKKAKRVSATCVRREATEREITFNMPEGPVPVAA